MYYVYCIENIVNRKLYIGKAKNVNQRWSQHKRTSLNKDKKSRFYNALRKHGIASFKLTIIDQDENEEVCYKKETEWILKFNSINPDKGYNMGLGGEGNRGRTITEDQREVRSKISKRNYTPEVTARLREAKGTKEAKLNASIAARGSANSRAKLTEKEVLEIRQLHETKVYTQLKLAELFNTPTSTINHIVKRYTWKHI